MKHIELKEKISKMHEEILKMKNELKKVCPHEKIKELKYQPDEWESSNWHIHTYKCTFCDMKVEEHEEEYTIFKKLHKKGKI